LAFRVHLIHHRAVLHHHQEQVLVRVGRHPREVEGVGAGDRGGEEAGEVLYACPMLVTAWSKISVWCSPIATPWAGLSWLDAKRTVNATVDKPMARAN
jgi:hypothetical protein